MTSQRQSVKRFSLIIGVILTLFQSGFTVADSRVESIASILREVTGQLEKFNSLYINKLERELSLTSARLSAMDSTLRSVADRALAWDNIQNHMTVWTDQTRTMEKKLDMLNRCHEKQAGWESKLSAVDALNHKLTALDKKINAMTRLEFKVEKVSERVEEMDSKLNHIRETSASSRSDQHSTLTQLANRGLVSYLTTMDNKLDNISRQINHQKTFTKYKSPKLHGSRSRSVWQVDSSEVNPEKDMGECFLAPHDSQMIEDVSGKVDLLFDKIIDPDYDYNVFVGNLKRQAPSPTEPPPKTSDHHHHRNRHDNSHDQDLEFDSTPEHVFARFWKSLFAPFKKMNRRFRSLEKQLSNVARSCNVTDGSKRSEGSSEDTSENESILKKKIEEMDDALREEVAEVKVTLTDQATTIENLSQMVRNSGYVTKQVQTEIARQFEAQRAVTQSRFQELRNLVTQYCAKESVSTTPTTTMRTTTSETPSVVPVYPTYTPRSPTNRSKRLPFMRTSVYTKPKPTRCLPKDSPFWQVPHLARTLPLCPNGMRNNLHHDYRINYYKPQSGSTKRTFRKSSKNSVIHSYGGKSIRKRDLKYENELISNVGNSIESPNHVKQDCSEYINEDNKMSSVYIMGDVRDYNEENRDYFTRYCDQDTDGGGWTVIQRRGQYPQENFTRSWEEYKLGFGSLEEDFWFGNDFIHRLTAEDEYMLRFDLWDFDGNYVFAEYNSFKIGSEVENYALSVSGYRGNASDSFSAHNGYAFSTYDNDNDEAPECCPCAPAYGGGWWFYSCFESNLNGEYHNNPNDNDYYRGLIWELWLGDYSLRATEIKIRPASLFTSTIFPTPFPGPYPTNTLLPELP